MLAANSEREQQCGSAPQSEVVRCSAVVCTAVLQQASPKRPALMHTARTKASARDYHVAQWPAVPYVC